MSDTKRHIDKTSAESKSIGFDFQYYFFLSKLLELRSGQSVGLEVKDDVHTDLENDIQIFYQVKHTISTKSDGTPSNLTSADIDLWKTLSNWSKVISDENDDRISDDNQIVFLKRSYFVLFSNKSSSINNTIINILSSFQAGNSGLEKVISFFNQFRTQTENDTIKGYVNDVLQLNNPVIELFFKRITFELGEDSILEKCKQSIKAKMIPENKIDEVFASVDSKVRADNFLDIKSGSKIQLSFNDFYEKYGLLFNVVRDGSLQIKDYSYTLPDRIEEQTFIKQLLDIGDIQSDDLESMTQFTGFKLKLITNLNEWYTQGEVTNDELLAFDKEAIAKWRNKFRRAFRSGEFTIEESIDLIDSLREIILNIANQGLDTELSNGQFYHLSDKPEIGWTRDWEKYKTDK